MFYTTEYFLDLFGGEPVASSDPPWESAEHHILPYHLWGENQRPLPTNVWWQNMVLETENGELISVADPYIVKETLTNILFHQTLKGSIVNDITLIYKTKQVKQRQNYL